MEHSLTQLRQANNTKKEDKTSHSLPLSYPGNQSIENLREPDQNLTSRRAAAAASKRQAVDPRKRLQSTTEPKAPAAGPSNGPPRKKTGFSQGFRAAIAPTGGDLFRVWGLGNLWKAAAAPERGEAQRRTRRDETRRMGKEASGGGNRKRRPAFSSWRPVGRLSAPPQPSDQLRYDVAVQIWKTNNPSR